MSCPRCGSPSTEPFVVGAVVRVHCIPCGHVWGGVAPTPAPYGRIYGRLGVAPCGHPGEAIVGHYYRCHVGCDAAGSGPPSDGVPELSDDIDTGVTCRCGSDDLTCYPSFGVTGGTVWNCRNCFRTWIT